MKSFLARTTRPALAAAALSLVATLAPPAADAQDLHPSRRPSPMGMARITLDDTYVRVVYSRPYERGRENIFGTEESGALVPWGELWRTGANESTEITFTGDVLFAGEEVAAGTYTLFTTPGEESWKVHLSSALGLSGTGTFDPEAEEFVPVDLEATEVIDCTVPVEEAEEKVEQFTISFEETGEGAADMVLAWIHTRVRVPIEVVG